MAGKGNNVSDCIHASNPYHDCSEYCFDKKGESKTHKARKHSGYDGALKSNGDRKNTVRTDCTRASNPYHDCNEFCSNKTNQAGRPEAKSKRDLGAVVIDTSKTIGGRKGSRPKPPRELDVVLSSAASSDPQVTKSHVSPEVKIDSRNSDYIEPYSERTRLVDDPLPIKEKNKFSQLILVSGNVAKADTLQDTHKNDASLTSSVKLKKDIDVKPQEFPEMAQVLAVHDKEESPHATASSNITSFRSSDVTPDLTESEEEEEEIKSVSSESSVSVGKYHVKASFASILQSIFNKHGDIAGSCKLESFSIRSYYLGCVCYIVQELQCTKFPQMSKYKVRELLAILKDIESSDINVGWLRSILDEVAEAVEFSSQHSTVEAAKANCDCELESTKKELESQMKDLTLKEKEVADAKAKVADTRARLSELEFKYFQLNEAISSVRLKVNNLQCKALTDELL